MNWDQDMLPTYGTPSLTLVHGAGSKVTDDRGRQYTDLLGGIAVNILGHTHPAIVEAVRRQIGQLGHTSNLYANQPALELASNLRRHAPDHKVFLCNSGTEANEAALKAVRRHAHDTDRPEGIILAFENGFHGRSTGALALTWNPAYKDRFGPLPDQIVHIPFNDPRALEAAFEDLDIVGVFVESVQGEGGVIPMTPDMAAVLDKQCRNHDALLVVDEVQTGIGRTGRFFAHEHHALKPDIITLAKGLGGGMPIGATLIHERLAPLMGPASHGSTFGGNPVACAAANAVLGIVDDDMFADVRRKGALLEGALQGAGYESRGMGLLQGIVVPEAAPVVAAMQEAGWLVGSAGKHTVRLAPPLTVTDEELLGAVAALAGVLSPLPAH